MRNDVLFDFAKTKTDQEGIKNIDHLRHVYINPLDPIVCPVLGLARYIISNSTILSGKSNLFEGKSQYERFNRILAKVIDDNVAKCIALGVTPSDFGTHSI